MDILIGIVIGIPFGVLAGVIGFKIQKSYKEFREICKAEDRRNKE